ncbi:MAG: MBL fold metallo-hydrolase [Candidatus Poseidoniaceae archaeon]|jgi:pyrroloquinoline quinone biosynthesis protein B|nr:MBL fold metallo-hydrolase [Candidatus Poseidoniaceae archaeon]
MIEVVLLGSAQDGGVPQVGCNCCIDLKQRYPVSIGLSDSDGGKHLFEATRNLGEQLRLWGVTEVDSVFLTHAHFGHVDGLGLFGKETMGVKGINLYCSKSMSSLIERTPNWSLLLTDGVFNLNSESEVKFPGVSIESLKIPHRSELSDMHAYLLRGDKTLLFLPDHDTWSETLEGKDIRTWLSDLGVDIALIDGTFMSEDELQNRDQSKIPHPPVKQTLQMLGQRQKGDPEIVFIHLNHTNPLCYDTNPVSSLGWKVGIEGMRFII